MDTVMKQSLLVLLLGAALVAADKRPLFRGRQPFAFQRQTDGAAPPPETEDLSPPAPGGALPSPSGGTPGAPGADAGGPYPPSGQPESGGPYPPSGWKPQGQRLELPARQQKPQQQYGAPPKQPQQQYGAPPKQPQQQYGAPPKQPQQQYGAPEPEPAPAEPQPTETPEPTTESVDQVQATNNRLRQQLRQQRVVLQRLRQQVRDQQLQLQQLRDVEGQSEQDANQGQQGAQGEYVVTLPDGRLQKVQYAATPSSSSVFKQSVTPALQPSRQEQQVQQDPPTYVARLQFMEVPPIDAPVFSYSGSAPLLRVA